MTTSLPRAQSHRSHWTAKVKPPSLMQILKNAKIACGTSKNPKEIEVPISAKSSVSQCHNVRITEIDDSSNDNDVALAKAKTLDYHLQEKSGDVISPFTLFPTSASICSSVAATEDNEVTLMIPKQVQSYMVISTKAPTSQNQNFATEEKEETETNGTNATKTFTSWALKKIIGFINWNTLPYVAMGGFIIVIFFPYLCTLALLMLGYVMFNVIGVRSKPKMSKRTVKWAIPNFSEEIQSEFLTCPTFKEKSGEWRLFISQKPTTGTNETETTLGLILTDISIDVECVIACMRFACTNIRNQELSPGMSRMKFQHRFYRCGDCFETKPFILSENLVGNQDTINLVCRIDFKGIPIGYMKSFRMWYGLDAPRTNAKVEIGIIRQEILSEVEESRSSSETESILQFIQHHDAKTFMWEIPNFAAMIMKNNDVWGVFSPLFIFHCDGVCSVWRLKLVEINGVFRLHIQLRGLPQNVKQVKIWYLLQTVDSFGDSSVPEHFTARMKYPDYLNFGETSRHILFRRETLLARYLRMDGSLAFRMSLRVNVTDIPLLEKDSDEWLNNRRQ